MIQGDFRRAGLTPFSFPACLHLGLSSDRLCDYVSVQTFHLQSKRKHHWGMLFGLQRNGNNSLEGGWENLLHCKSTHADQIPNYNSNHSKANKRSCIQTLLKNKHSLQHWGGKTNKEKTIILSISAQPIPQKLHETLYLEKAIRSRQKTIKMWSQNRSLCLMWRIFLT